MYSLKEPLKSAPQTRKRNTKLILIPGGRYKSKGIVDAVEGETSDSKSVSNPQGLQVSPPPR